jgi:hypothetical protein
MICIAIAALLLSLTGGMFLLAKIQKDNLGTFYKVMAWLVIVASLATLLCCAVCCVAWRQCMRMPGHGQSEMMCAPGQMDCCGGGSCSMGGMKHGGMMRGGMMHRGMMREDCCMDGKAMGKCCEEEEDDDRAEIKREIIVKDTVIKK